MSSLPQPLIDLAQAYGIYTEYYDVSGNLKIASVESLIATLRLLGADLHSPDQARQAMDARNATRANRAIEPVVVVWEGRPAEFTVTLPRESAAATIRLTLDFDGEHHVFDFSWDELPEAPCDFADSTQFDSRRVTFPIPVEMGCGYWPLSLEFGEERRNSMLILAPPKAFGAPAGSRTWGCFLPVYSIRSERNWGAGDYTDLRNLAEWVGQQGGGVLGTLPLLAGFLDEPCDPSPYSPCTRLFWNEFFIDVERVPELANCEAARSRLQSTDFAQELAACREGDYVDYKRLMRLKRSVLELLAESLQRQGGPRLAALHAFVATTDSLDDYATYRAAHERQRKPWWMWPDRMRDGHISPEDFDSAAKHYHLYAQWIASEQLEATLRAGSEESAKATAQLYLDLPLGVRRDAYDVWRNRSGFIVESSVGAPPDAIFTGGQNWGFCPLHPDAIREQGYAHVRHYLGRHMHAARMLRVDHVMGLHRLFWIPDGRPASDGVYVRYRAEEFYAILSLESHRHKTCILGENLGTVPPGVNEMMDEHAIRRMFVVQYELQCDVHGDDMSRPPFNVPPANSVASLNTHDMPMFSAWWRGEDIDDRRQMNLMDDQGCRNEHDTRKWLRELLSRWVRTTRHIENPSESDVLTALLEYLAASPAELLLVNLEDLWQETRTQNVPGTWKERPNWQRRAAHRLEEIASLAPALELLRRVHAARQTKE